MNKALYGLKGAPRCWNERFNEFAIKHHFKRSKNDFCVYARGHMVMVIYVDDILLTGEKEEIEKVVLLLKKQFQTRDLGELKNYLGIQIDRYHDRIKISQEDMID